MSSFSFTAHKMRPAKIFGKIVFYVIITLAAILVLVPFLWMLSTSFKGAEPIRTIPIRWIPEHPTLSSYAQVIGMSSFNFGRATFNSFFIAITCTVVQVLSVSMAGFIFAKIPFKGREKVFLLYLAPMMIPTTVTLIPSYTILNGMHLLDTYWAMILLALNNAFGVFLMRQNMSAVHDAYLEAAMMDGCSMAKIFFKIMLPMCKPAVATMTLMAFMGAWNDYLKPLIILTSNDMQTLQLALATLNCQAGGKENILMAGAVLTILPILIVYICVQRYIDEGLQIGGMKG